MDNTHKPQEKTRPKKLTKRQSTYCYYRARGHTIEDSVYKAGYKVKKEYARNLGSQMEMKLNITNTIQEERLNIFDKSKVTTELILEHLHTLATQGKTEATRLRALELLGKHKAMFVDSQHIQIDEATKHDKELFTRYGIGRE